MSTSTENLDPETGMVAKLEETAGGLADVVPAHEDGARIESPVETRGGISKLGLIFIVALLFAIAYGLYDRHMKAATLSQDTREASILTVAVVHPTPGSQADDLVLPGNVQAFTQTPIYSRTNGYLKKWYFDIGSHVRQGQLLAQIEAPEVDQQLNQSRAELERMQANAQLAGVTSARWQALLAKNAVSKQETDQAKSDYVAAQAAVDASRANVRRLEQMQAYERIIAPFDGVITARNTDIGDLIDAGSGSSNPRALFQLASLHELRVYVSVPEVDSNAIHDGDSAYLTEDARPGVKIPGRIVRNSDAIDPTTRTLNVEVDVDNSRDVLRPGAYVFVHIHVPADRGSFTLASNTLLFRADGLRVGVVRQGGRVELVPVTIGHDFGNSVEITSGLTAQDAVIVDPSDSLASGMEVHAKPADAGGRS